MSTEKQNQSDRSDPNKNAPRPDQTAMPSSGQTAGKPNSHGTGMAADAKPGQSPSGQSTGQSTGQATGQGNGQTGTRPGAQPGSQVSGQTAKPASNDAAASKSGPVAPTDSETKAAPAAPESEIEVPGHPGLEKETKRTKVYQPGGGEVVAGNETDGNSLQNGVGSAVAKGNGDADGLTGGQADVGDEEDIEADQPLSGEAKPGQSAATSTKRDNPASF